MPVTLASGEPQWRHRTTAGRLALWFGWLALVAVTVASWRVMTRDTIWEFLLSAPTQAATEGRADQMIACRIFADTHSLSSTAARITIRIMDTCGQASVESEASSCRPMPPAPTRPRIADSRMLMSQR